MEIRLNQIGADSPIPTKLWEERISYHLLAQIAWQPISFSLWWEDTEGGGGTWDMDRHHHHQMIDLGLCFQLLIATSNIINSY